MLRLFALTVVELVANAIGLLVAKWLLPGFMISPAGFLWVIVIFTAARFVLAPLIFKLSFKYVRAITGGIALVTTFVGLLVTTWVTDGLQISGFSTWVIATLLVWLAGENRIGGAASGRYTNSGASTLPASRQCGHGSSCSRPASARSARRTKAVTTRSTRTQFRTPIRR